ncbi:hypothetical protein VNO77_17137 [Canavalia gladiata]|uniref:Uncharacterized protein n=1 Tax=Canavalia gladiata TaxID=3824 RepID=A0AAN9QJ41_CANGL
MYKKISPFPFSCQLFDGVVHMMRAFALGSGEDVFADRWNIYHLRFTLALARERERERENGQKKRNERTENCKTVEPKLCWLG